jgi:hypothetical protein
VGTSVVTCLKCQEAILINNHATKEKYTRWKPPNILIYTGRFIMYSGITKIYYRKTVGHVFTKPVQIEGTPQAFFPPNKLFFIVVHTDHCSSEEYRCTHVDACVARTWISYRCVPCHPCCTRRISLVVKSFLVTVKNSINVGPLVLLL